MRSEDKRAKPGIVYASFVYASPVSTLPKVTSVDTSVDGIILIFQRSALMSTLSTLYSSKKEKREKRGGIRSLGESFRTSVDSVLAWTPPTMTGSFLWEMGR